MMSSLKLVRLGCPVGLSWQMVSRLREFGVRVNVPLRRYELLEFGERTV
jgi:hypothetical protein